MLPHTLHANKYQSQATQFANPPAMIVALCEKAISCISAAQKALENQKKHSWRTNLGTVQDILHLISSTIHNSQNKNELQEMEKFYNNLLLYTKGLIIEKIESSKSQELLEAFRITRDMWKGIEHKYIELKEGGSNNTPPSDSFSGIL